MRLKENKNNWKASNIIRKVAVAPEQPKHRSKKNTKRWCKGRVGVEHDYQPKETIIIGTITKSVQVCTHCGKQDWRSVRYGHTDVTA